MGTTRFSGPVMYSGHGSDSSYLGSWFGNLPMQVNPDYIFKNDDFTGIDIDDTDDWTKSVLNSGTLTLLADHVGGWAKSTGDGSTDNSGGAIQGNEIFLAEASKNIYFETRVAVADADDMDMFVGLAENGTFATGVPFTASNQIGFLLVEVTRPVIRRYHEDPTSQTHNVRGPCTSHSRYRNRLPWKFEQPFY